MDEGNQVKATEILSQIPEGNRKIIQATDLNKLSNAMLALERFYKNDIEDYIDTKQSEWISIINQFSYKGTWETGTTYAVNNIVSYTVNGVEFLYIMTNNAPAGTVPTNSQYWRLLTLQGQQGESGEGLSFREPWNSSTQYYKDDVVSYNGSVYVALENNINTSPSDNDTQWKLIMSLEVESYPIQPTPPLNQKNGGLWFNTNTTPTKYYYLDTLDAPATENEILQGYQAYGSDGNALTGTYQPINPSDYVSTDGANPMTGNLNMASHKITNVSSPTAASDATNKQYVDTQATNALNNAKTYVDTQLASFSTTPFHLGTSAPTNTKLLWIDTTGGNSILKYYNGSTWKTITSIYSA